MKLLRYTLIGMAWFLSAIVVVYVSESVWKTGSWAEKKALALTLQIAWLGVLAVVPLAWARWLLLRYQRRARITDGNCGMCGFDLRASVNHCPECGATLPCGANTLNSNSRPNKLTPTLQITMLTLICGLGILLATNTELGARLRLRVLWPAQTALADAWYAKSFDSTEWQAPANREQAYYGRHPRGDMLKDLLDRFPLVGCPVREVESLLGTPDQRDFHRQGNYAYFLGPERAFMSVDYAWLVLQFDELAHVVLVEVIVN